MKKEKNQRRGDGSDLYVCSSEMCPSSTSTSSGTKKNPCGSINEVMESEMSERKKEWMDCIDGRRAGGWER